MEEYEIAWRGPFTYEDLDREGEVFEEEIYAIVWLPPKRKRKTLYVGITFVQYLRNRLKGYHAAGYRIYDKRGDVSIRYFLGCLLLEKGQRRSKRRLLRVEEAIIYYHYNYEDICEDNKQGIRTMNYNDFKIRNTGNVPPGIVDFYVDGDDSGRL